MDQTLGAGIFVDLGKRFLIAKLVEPLEVFIQIVHRTAVAQDIVEVLIAQSADLAPDLVIERMIDEIQHAEEAYAVRLRFINSRTGRCIGDGDFVDQGIDIGDRLLAGEAEGFAIACCALLKTCLL